MPGRQVGVVRLGDSPDATEWASRIDRGLLRISSLSLLEVGYAARSAEDLRAGVRRPPLSSMPVAYLTPSVEDRAVQVQQLLADRGLHRAPSIPDLLIAAAAELMSLCVLHVDQDCDVIAGVTGQPVERLATRA